MKDLRASLIALGNEHPELRAHLKPVIAHVDKTAAVIDPAYGVPQRLVDLARGLNGKKFVVRLDALPQTLVVALRADTGSRIEVSAGSADWDMEWDRLTLDEHFRDRQYPDRSHNLAGLNLTQAIKVFKDALRRLAPDPYL